MNNNTISNPKTKVNKGEPLNDKDYGNCLLSSLKEMSKNYVIALTEASNDNLYKKLLASFQRIIDLQREVYEVLFVNGWYTLEQAEENKIIQKEKMLNQEYTDLNK